MAVAFGRYQLMRKLARGGMGQVLLALEPAAKRLVVIKRLAPALAGDPAFLQMFLEEAQLIERLRHPRIVRLYEHGRSDAGYYLALEYVQGADLRALQQRCQSQKQPLTFAMTCRIIADAAAGLDAAHKTRDESGGRLDLVHRDVSPQNLLVGLDGAVRVTDFGIAKAVGREQTVTGIVKGKFPYMSPEQANGEPLDRRSDIFSLGIVLWELLTRRRLFKGDTDMQSLQLVRDCQVPPPSRLVPAVPSGLEQVAMRALSKDPDKRFQQAEAMADAVEELTHSDGLRVSRTDLGAHVRRLFPDRAALELGAPGLDLLSSLAELDGEAEPSRSLPAERPSAVEPESPPRRRSHVRYEKEETRAVTQALERIPAVRRPPRKLLAVLVATLALVGGAVAVLLLWPEAETRVAGVTVALTSEPAGAEVLIEGRRLGRTPLEYAVGSNAPPVRAQFRLEGYEPVELPLSAKSAPQLSVRLARRQ